MRVGVDKPGHQHLVRPVDHIVRRKAFRHQADTRNAAIFAVNVNIPSDRLVVSQNMCVFNKKSHPVFVLRI